MCGRKGRNYTLNHDQIQVEFSFKDLGIMETVSEKRNAPERRMLLHLMRRICIVRIVRYCIVRIVG